MSLAMHSAKGKLTLEAAAPSSTHSTMVGGSYDGKIAGLYDLEETLGSGHFAVVKLARHVFTGAKVAVKVVDKTKLDEVSKAHLFQEVRCMKLVQHPNVVRLYEVIDTQTKLYLVLELGDGGDLYDYIMKHEGGLSEDLARKYFRQILRAITYCHELHVVHRDLKPENVVFFEKLGVVKLTDFGFSNKFLPGQKLQTSCGSLAYSAPEILLGDSYDAPAVDIWSLGVILYMLVCGVPPFEKANDSETLTMIMDCKYTVPAHISASCRKLIASMLVRDPKQRASLEQIAADPWLKENVEYDNNDFLPLVSREEISEEDHAFIIQKMVNGKVTTKEEILQSLDKNMYNHITATYYLLAEMLLRKRQEEQTTTTTTTATTNARNDTAMMLSENATTTTKTKGGDNAYNARPMPDNKTQANPNDDGQKVAIPISINVCAPTPNLHETKPEKRSRKCSIVREEDEEESSCEQSAHHGNELKVGFGRRESISDGRLNRSVQERAKSPVATPVVVSTHSRNKMLVPVDATLAQKLNQIEKHSDPALATAKSKLEEEEALQDLKELDIGKLNPLSSSSKNPVLTHRRSKLNKIRTPSCSSSEASDDDTKARNKKKMNKYVGDTPSRFRMHRRDSHDDSSDSQDPTFPSAGSHANTNTNILGSNNSNVGNGKKESQTQSKDQNKSDDKDKDTRKSSHSHSHKNKKQHKHEQNPDKHSHQSDCRKSLASTHNSNSNNNNNNHHHTNNNNNNHNNNNNNNNNNTTSRRRIRESQSLDRITEAQEYELRHRCLGADSHIEQRNSLFNLNSYSLIETKEEYDEESQTAQQQQQQQQETINDLTQQKKEHQHHHHNHNHHNPNSLNGSGHALLHLKKRNKPNMYKLNSIEEIDSILEERSLAKAIQVTSSKCFVTMKKIRRLGKYFPVVNFS